MRNIIERNIFILTIIFTFFIILLIFVEIFRYKKIKKITENDFVFYNEYKYTENNDEKDSNQGYNLGDLLNIRSIYAGDSLDNPHSNDNYYEQYKKKIKIYNNSILTIYNELRKNESEVFPNIKNVQKSVDIYIERNKNNNYLMDILRLVSNNNTLLVHLRSSDRGVTSDYFINIIKGFQIQYETIIVCCGIHRYEGKENLVTSINKLISNDDYNNIYIHFAETDVHVCMFHKCKNLLIHKNGFSILAALVFTGNKLYITKEFDYDNLLKNPNNKWNNYFNSEDKKFNEIIILD
jgi:hypothetical protein